MGCVDSIRSFVRVERRGRRNAVSHRSGAVTAAAGAGLKGVTSTTWAVAALCQRLLDIGINASADRSITSCPSTTVLHRGSGGVRGAERGREGGREHCSKISACGGGRREEREDERA